jgi:hypothetical protein
MNIFVMSIPFVVQRQLLCEQFRQIRGINFVPMVMAVEVLIEIVAKRAIHGLPALASDGFSVPVPVPVHPNRKESIGRK